MDHAPLLTMHGDNTVLATAIHAGHDLRPEIEAQMSLAEATRTREEDPATDRIAAAVPGHVIVHRSRFEVDVNRAVRRRLPTTRRRVGPRCVASSSRRRRHPRSRSEHDVFYATVRGPSRTCRARAPFVVLDVHSYNHRALDPTPRRRPCKRTRTSTWAREPSTGHGSAQRPIASSPSSARRRCTAATHVRENVRFRGGYFSRWVHEQFPGRGCALAIEFKKTFMDEWAGVVDDDHVSQLGAALRATLPTLTQALAEHS